jgi:hypothetical protein
MVAMKETHAAAWIDAFVGQVSVQSVLILPVLKNLDVMISTIRCKCSCIAILSLFSSRLSAMCILLMIGERSVINKGFRGSACRLVANNPVTF